MIWETFLTYEAPDYSEEGVAAFQKTALENADYLNGLTFYGAFLQEELAGVIATRKQGSHIALFFVKDGYHRRGIGKALFQTVLDHGHGDITVHSSPYAVPVYRRLGFVETGRQQQEQGILFTPMIYRG